MARALPVSAGATLSLEIGPDRNFACGSTGVSWSMTGG